MRWFVAFTLNLICVLLGLSLLIEALLYGTWELDRMAILIVTALIVTPLANLLQ